MSRVKRLLQRRHGGVHAEIGVSKLREPLDVRGMHRINLRLHLLDRRSRAQAPDVEETIARARAVRLLRISKGQRNPELDALAWRPGMTIVAAVEERKARRHHADDGVAAPGPPEPQLLSDDGRITSVESPPEAMAQDDLVLGADLTFRIGKRPPERRRHAQQPKQ